jgi:hypothetical protein
MEDRLKSAGPMSISTLSKSAEEVSFSGSFVPYLVTGGGVAATQGKISQQRHPEIIMADVRQILDY